MRNRVLPIALAPLLLLSASVRLRSSVMLNPWLWFVLLVCHHHHRGGWNVPLPQLPVPASC